MKIRKYLVKQCIILMCSVRIKYTFISFFKEYGLYKYTHLEIWQFLKKGSVFFQECEYFLSVLQTRTFRNMVSASMPRLISWSNRMKNSWFPNFVDYTQCSNTWYPPCDYIVNIWIKNKTNNHSTKWKDSRLFTGYLFTYCYTYFLFCLFLFLAKTMSETMYQLTKNNR